MAWAPPNVYRVLDDFPWFSYVFQLKINFQQAITIPSSMAPCHIWPLQHSEDAGQYIIKTPILKNISLLWSILLGLGMSIKVPVLRRISMDFQARFPSQPIQLFSHRVSLFETRSPWTPRSNDNIYFTMVYHHFPHISPYFPIEPVSLNLGHAIFFANGRL